MFRFHVVEALPKVKETGRRRGEWYLIEKFGRKIDPPRREDPPLRAHINGSIAEVYDVNDRLIAVYKLIKRR